LTGEARKWRYARRRCYLAVAKELLIRAVERLHIDERELRARQPGMLAGVVPGLQLQNRQNDTQDAFQRKRKRLLRIKDSATGDHYVRLITRRQESDSYANFVRKYTFRPLLKGNAKGMASQHS